MTDFKAPPIVGYRDLSAEEVALINAIKELEAQAGALIHQLTLRNTVEHAGKRVQDDAGVGRWVSLARTNLETGFMYLAKAVARPTNGLGRLVP